MDKIFYNGIIKTLDNKDSIFQAVGIKNGKIVFIGTNEEAEKLNSKDRIDLCNKLMLPGFVDSHMHMINYAFVENSVKLFECKSVEEILKKASDRLINHRYKDIKWMYCRGWNEDNFFINRYPTKEEIDSISRDIPIIMVRVCGHIGVVNSVGLEKLKNLPEFEEIKNEVDFNTGLIKENAVQFFYSTLDKPSQKEVEGYIDLAMQRLNQKGITGIQSDDFSSLPGKDWQLILNSFNSMQLKDKMTVRVYEQCLFERIDDFKDFIDRGYRSGQKGEYFTIGTLKVLQDGSLGAKTAALCEPYEGEKDNIGIVTFNQEELDGLVDLASKYKFQIAVHCIGDRAMEMVISALSKAQEKYNLHNMRNGIVHAQITNEKILKQMKENNIIAYIQPVFVDLDMDVVESRIGFKRMNKVYAWKSMIDMGILAVGGSDAPVVSFDVLENIYFAVTRKNINLQPKEGWIPEEKLDVEEAVKLFTKYPSYSSFTEDTNGTIEVGKKADLVVLDDNIYKIDCDKIKDVKINYTIVNGNIVYNRIKKQ